MLTDEQKEKMLKWAGYLHYNPNDVNTYFYRADDPKKTAIFEPNLESLDVLIGIVESKLKPRCSTNYDVFIRGYRDFCGKVQPYYCELSIDGKEISSSYINDRIVGDNQAAALQQALLKLAEAETK